MSKLRFRISMSLEAWRRPHGLDGGDVTHLKFVRQ